MIAVRYTGLRAGSSFRDSHGGEGPEGADVRLDVVLPRLAEGLRMDDEALAVLHVDEARQAAVAEVEFRRIQQMEEVDAEAAVEVGIEGLEKFGGIAEEIGEEDEGAFSL